MLAVCPSFSLPSRILPIRSSLGSALSTIYECTLCNNAVGVRQPGVLSYLEALGQALPLWRLRRRCFNPQAKERAHDIDQSNPDDFSRRGKSHLKSTLGTTDWTTTPAPGCDTTNIPLRFRLLALPRTDHSWCMSNRIVASKSDRHTDGRAPWLL